MGIRPMRPKNPTQQLRCNTYRDTDQNKQQDGKVIFEVHDYAPVVQTISRMICGSDVSDLTPPIQQTTLQVPRQKASAGATVAGLVFFGADGETRTRTAFATTPSR
ncbi:hypothetical protein CPter291_3321 [Collimonas pratensis]|uniref:Uncharacterized protein n=2 Tax=Collimonas pratensis TaxID=279113 RepID=A0ABN4MBS7_9BURK|nr:hypothetical protein CPter291_3321 [Collimonas pratensis]